MFKEWGELKDGKIKLQDFILKYDFDYIVAMEYENQIYEIKSGYELIYDSKNEALGGEKNEDENDKTGVRVYKKANV